MQKIRSFGIALIQPLLMITLSTLAHAAGGTGLPWDEPMTTVSDALWGTPARCGLSF